MYSRLCSFLLVLLIAGSGICAPGDSQKAEETLQSLLADSQTPWESVRDGSQIRWLTGGTLILGTTDPVTAGNRFLTAYGSALGLTDPPQETRLRYTKSGRTITRLDYDQFYGGRRVVDGRLVLGVDHSGTLRAVHSSLQIPSSVNQAPTLRSTEITSEEAIQAAVNGLRIRSQRAPATAEAAVLIEEGNPIDVWEARIASADPLGDFRVLVHSSTGKLLRKRNLLHRLDGTGMVFDPNPVVTLRRTDLQDRNDAADSVPSSAYRTVTLRDIDPSGILRGPYVDVTGRTSRAQEPGLRFFYNRGQEEFEQVMAYYHLDRVHRYLISLGYDTLVDYPLSVVTNADSEDQSYYTSFTKKITYGAGGVDDAEDGDIIVHEYGHAILDDQIRGFGTSEEAMAIGEGFGDYLAFSNDPDGTFNPEIIGDWDAVAYSAADPPYLRRMNEPVRYPQDLVYQEHLDGRIWSHALYDIWDLYGKTFADTLVLESHYLLTPSASFFDGAQAVYDTFRRMNGDSGLDELFDIFDKRGLAAPTLSTSHKVAVAGETVQVPMLDQVLGGGASFRWEQVSGPAAENRVVSEDRLTFNAPDPPNDTLIADLLFQLHTERGGQVISTNDFTTHVLSHDVRLDNPPRLVSIPDNSERGLERSIEVASLGPVQKIVLYFDVQHSYRGDLQVELIGPSGLISTVVPASGSPGTDLETLARAGGTEPNDEALNVFLGTEAGGRWSLKISDIAAADTGALKYWALGIRARNTDKPNPVVFNLHSEDILYGEQFESGDLENLGFAAYPGGLEGTYAEGTAQVGLAAWGEGSHNRSLLLSAEPGEVITVALKPTEAVAVTKEALFSARVRSSGPGGTIAVALVEQTFDGSIGYQSTIDTARYQDSWDTVTTVFSPESGGVIPILQLANLSGTSAVSVAIDDLAIYGIEVVRH